MSNVHRESTASAAFGRLVKVEAHVLRWPVRVPVRTSFGTMHDRPAVLVRVEDADGAHGWGEAWCNFPSCGAEHRARLIETVLAPLLIGSSFASAEAAWAELTAKTAVLAIQSGEPGPIAQAIAGVDIALHDLAARRRGLPLWRHLARDGAADDRRAVVPVYASGINPDRPGDTVAALRAAGYTAFKRKVGFGEARDVANLAAVRAAAGADATVMVDANQAWDLEAAVAMARRLAPSTPAWLEEPLRADRPWPEWRRLAADSPIPLAAGENMIGEGRSPRSSPRARSPCGTADTRQVGRHLWPCSEVGDRTRRGCATARTTGRRRSACSPRPTCSRPAATPPPGSRSTATRIRCAASSARRWRRR